MAFEFVIEPRTEGIEWIKIRDCSSFLIQLLTLLSVLNLQGSFYPGLDDGLLMRGDGLPGMDLKRPSPSSMMRHDALLQGYGEITHAHNPTGNMRQMLCFGSPGESMMEQLTGMHMPMAGMTAPPTHAHHPVSDPGGFGLSGHSTGQMYPHSLYAHNPISVSCSNSFANLSPPPPSMGMNHGMLHHPANSQTPSMMTPPLPSDHTGSGNDGGCGNSMAQCSPPETSSPVSSSTHTPQTEVDPRELEAFAEHFKQRRIKLGVTQADVGSALGKLKIPGVGSLSQSTICRFESLTLSHNNMIALKPVLQAWLEEAEQAVRDSKVQADSTQGGAIDKKRKRTSIAAPEKRSLEAYFAIQPRPSGEKIAQIAEKLDLKKNVVRVWFCNQRQKQKRMKFSAAVQNQHSPH